MVLKNFLAEIVRFPAAVLLLLFRLPVKDNRTEGGMPVPPKAFQDLLQDLVVKKATHEDKDRFLNQRLEDRCDTGKTLSATKDAVSSDDLACAETRLKSALEDYLIPEGKRSFRSVDPSDRKNYFPRTSCSSPFNFLLSRFGVGKNTSRSVWQYVKQIKGVSRKQIARRFYELGRIQELKNDFQEALSSYEKAVQYDPETPLYLYQLGGVLHALGDDEKAAVHYGKALASDLKTFLEERPNVNPPDRSGTPSAEFRKLVEHYEKSQGPVLSLYGEESAHAAIHWENLGLACETLGQYEKAVEHYERSLAALVKAYGDEHPYVPLSWSNLGQACKKLGQYEKAIAHYEKALAIDLETYSSDHPSVARDWNNLGEVYQALARHETATRYFRDALNVLEKAFGREHPDAKRTADNLMTSMTFLNGREGRDNG
jgi:tetratricopeptide (TPR) repeat protein